MKITARDSIRILLVDDHTLFRESLRRLLNGEAEFEVCGDFASAEEALIAVRAGLIFDAALIDYDLGVVFNRTNGLDFLQQLRQLRPSARVLMVTAGMELGALSKAIEQLNAGIFLKSEPTAELLLAIQRTANGERWISSRAALALLAVRGPDREMEPYQRDDLNPRQALVLRGVLEGMSNKEIGARLDITESSVKAILQKLFEKAGVRSRSQLVRYAIEAQIEAKDK